MSKIYLRQTLSLITAWLFRLQGDGRELREPTFLMENRFDPYSRANQLVIDSIVFAISLTIAYLIRFEGKLDWTSSKQLMLWLPYLIAVRLIANWKLGIYRFIWRYVSLGDALAIGKSLSIVTILLLGLRVFYPEWAIFSRWARLPLSVIALEFLLSFFGSLSVRALRRLLYERSERLSVVHTEVAKRVILYGAGRAGFLLTKELKSQGNVELVGFIDDDPKKIGTVISGIKVLGAGDSLPKFVRHLGVDQIIISMATAGRRTLSQVVSRCEEIPVSAKIIPSLQEIIEGQVNISQVRDVRIEDLLGRESVEITEFEQDVLAVYAGKRILVTGAGGSIGSELVRQLLLANPHSIALLDKDENSTYELEQELVFRYPDARIKPEIADVRHGYRLQAIFRAFRPEIVFHAAAHKHVPLMERHPCEAILNNVSGTQTLLKGAREIGVERFVFISTDKAVNPTSIMGATKRVGELLVQAYASEGGMHCTCVRFGNVMGSRGSIIPLFKKQIAEGGPIKVTHPDVVRFFMTVPEAVHLVLCAGTLGEYGEVFVLDMGSPRKILDLAREMALLAGRTPGKDIEIAITGLRPGEKLSEELVGPDEVLGPTRFEKIAKIASQSQNGKAVYERLEALVEAAQRDDRDGVYRVLSLMRLGYKSPLCQIENLPNGH